MENDDKSIREMIKRHEGCRPYIYADSLGYLTGGYGHAFLPGSKISYAVAELLFDEDYQRAVDDYNKLELNLGPVRRAVVIDMLFNLGLTKFSGFKKMIAALRDGNYFKASDEMLDSLWARQVRSRAFRLASMMLTGELS